MRGAASADFVAGAARLERLPPPSLPEVAFAGRSNVGKSSLLNKILGRRSLARVSKTPGRTQQINFFQIDKRLLMVDLPGYGFARVPLAVKDGWRVLVEGYLTARRPLRGVFVLVDVRRGVEADYQQLLDFLDAHGVPSCVVCTKLDKITRGIRRNTRAAIGEDVIGFSAETGDGVEALWNAIDGWIR